MEGNGQISPGLWPFLYDGAVAAHVPVVPAKDIGCRKMVVFDAGFHVARKLPAPGNAEQGLALLRAVATYVNPGDALRRERSWEHAR